MKPPDNVMFPAEPDTTNEDGVSMVWYVPDCGYLHAPESGQTTIPGHCPDGHPHWSMEAVTYLPQGPRVYRQVKEFAGAVDEQSHPGQSHRWHDMLHDGRRGMGMAMCRCGAVGIVYGRDTRRSPRASRP